MAHRAWHSLRLGNLLNQSIRSAIMPVPGFNYETPDSADERKAREAADPNLQDAYAKIEAMRSPGIHLSPQANPWRKRVGRLFAAIILRRSGK